MANGCETLAGIFGLFGANRLLQPSFISRQAHSASALAIGNELLGEKV